MHQAAESPSWEAQQGRKQPASGPPEPFLALNHSHLGRLYRETHSMARSRKLTGHSIHTYVYSHVLLPMRSMARRHEITLFCLSTTAPVAFRVSSLSVCRNSEGTFPRRCSSYSNAHASNGIAIRTSCTLSIKSIHPKTQSTYQPPLSTSSKSEIPPRYGQPGTVQESAFPYARASVKGHARNETCLKSHSTDLRRS